MSEARRRELIEHLETHYVDVKAEDALSVLRLIRDAAPEELNVSTRPGKRSGQQRTPHELRFRLIHGRDGFFWMDVLVRQPLLLRRLAGIAARRWYLQQWMREIPVQYGSDVAHPRMTTANSDDSAEGLLPWLTAHALTLREWQEFREVERQLAWVLANCEPFSRMSRPAAVRHAAADWARRRGVRPRDVSEDALGEWVLGHEPAFFGYPWDRTLSGFQELHRRGRVLGVLGQYA